jgi:hypothetical protein
VLPVKLCSTVSLPVLLSLNTVPTLAVPQVEVVPYKFPALSGTRPWWIASVRRAPGELVKYGLGVGLTHLDTTPWGVNAAGGGGAKEVPRVMASLCAGIGLESHAQHELAKRQMSGFGSMISFELKGGMKAGRLLMDHVRGATLAVSLGGVETLIEHPASMTHASISPADRRAAGYSDGLVRYSVGIEDVEDLIADLRQALNAVAGAPDAPDRESAGSFVKVQS